MGFHPLARQTTPAAHGPLYATALPPQVWVALCDVLLLYNLSPQCEVKHATIRATIQSTADASTAAEVNRGLGEQRTRETVKLYVCEARDILQCACCAMEGTVAREDNKLGDRGILRAHAGAARKEG